MFAICLRPQKTKENESVIQTSSKDHAIKEDETKVVSKSLAKIEQKENKQVSIAKQEQVKQVTLSLSQLKVTKEDNSEKSQPKQSKEDHCELIQSKNEEKIKDDCNFDDQNNLKKIMDIKIFLTSDIQGNMNLREIYQDKDLLNRIILKQRFLKDKNHFDAKEYFGGSGLKKNELDQIFKQNKLTNSINSLFSKLSCCSLANTETVKTEHKHEIEITDNGILNKNFIDKQFNPYPQVDSVLSSFSSSENIQACLKQKDSQNQINSINTNDSSQSETEKQSYQMCSLKQGLIRPQSHQRDKFYQTVDFKKSQFTQEKTKLSLFHLNNQMTCKIQSTDKLQIKQKKHSFLQVEQVQKNIKIEKASCARKYTDGQNQIIKYIKDQLGQKNLSKEPKDQKSHLNLSATQSPQKNPLERGLKSENQCKIFNESTLSQTKEDFVQQNNNFKPQSPVQIFQKNFNIIQNLKNIHIYISLGTKNSIKQLQSVRKCLFYSQNTRTDKNQHA
ncbi:hypothetical protein TTHERM_00655500 (macronuclear) [Tetrahymena thermophila SB210]|uniref:Uncharacterized protein n=1 Tax=Tetrahymena thermophila (strain SB210) TaxID=312017 RepID=Q22H02_TETTS|nr:hypothetical protein TTHERM_00655500 [Tetrahymena thermophila SB210]EAR84522.2 hypothetical protein TTHERM_00655500 [Tetrahymena thermophila SB210]|eukprot:XP_001032185.2 hypothetical protein TTHERM_00655500 [Tetrahymena thermophila SB210]